MKYLKKFESFEMAEPMVKPVVKPSQPATKPGTTPGRPSPIRKDRPSVDPDPKARNKKASAEAIANRFVELSKEKSEDLKKYYK